MASLKMFTALFFTLAMFLGSALASPKCGKNAWILVTNEGKSDGTNASAWGHTQITSGLHSNDISWGTMQNAIANCLFNNERCAWDGYHYNCPTHPAVSIRTNTSMHDKKKLFTLTLSFYSGTTLAGVPHSISTLIALELNMSALNPNGTVHNGLENRLFTVFSIFCLKNDHFAAICTDLLKK
jgi:hypothetical protein